MRLLRSLYSLFILGILMGLHLIRSVFRKRITKDLYLRHFEKDNIKVIQDNEIKILYDASECICCNACSTTSNYINFYDPSDLCSRVSRDSTSYNMYMDKSINYEHGECPYNIDLGRISKFISLK